MKMHIILAISALFLCGCNPSTQQETVQKQENAQKVRIHKLIEQQNEIWASNQQIGRFQIITTHADILKLDTTTGDTWLLNGEWYLIETHTNYFDDLIPKKGKP